MKKRKLDLIVPVFNEEKNIQLFINKATSSLAEIGEYKIIFCLDPCSDNTEHIILSNIKKNNSLALIKMSRRFGQPTAVMVGIKNSYSDYVAIIDADDQDPPEVILDLYKKAQEGYDVVLAKRTKRDGESILKKFISYVGYRIINFLSDIKIEPDVGDFRIISHKVVKHLSQINEPSPFLRGLVSYIGFKTAIYEYERKKRYEGKGNYNRYFGSYQIGTNGIFSFSTKLLSYILFSGLFVCLVSFFFLLFIFFNYFFGLNTYPLGYPSTMIAIFFFGGVQLIAIGILGEYVGRIYDQVKNRPHYIVEKKINL